MWKYEHLNVISWLGYTLEKLKTNKLKEGYLLFLQGWFILVTRGYEMKIQIRLDNNMKFIFVKHVVYMIMNLKFQEMPWIVLYFFI